MKTAYCKIRVGDWKQTIHIKKGPFSLSEECQVPTSYLPDFFAKDKTLKKVYLSGGPKNFLQMIEKKTKEKQMLDNNNNNIIFIYSQI